MSLKQTLTDQMKAAMKSGDKETLLSLRLLLSDIKNFEIDNGEQDDAGVQKLVARSIKQWKDALSDYQKGGREDLVKEAEARIKLLEQFMPEQVSEEDIKKVIEEVIAGLPEGARQRGPVIGQVMKKLGGTADGGMVSRLVGEALS
jgi:uncharacterized protein YqeY